MLSTNQNNGIEIIVDGTNYGVIDNPTVDKQGYKIKGKFHPTQAGLKLSVSTFTSAIELKNSNGQTFHGCWISGLKSMNQAGKTPVIDIEITFARIRP